MKQTEVKFLRLYYFFSSSFFSFIQLGDELKIFLVKDPLEVLNVGTKMTKGSFFLNYTGKISSKTKHGQENIKEFKSC